MIFSDDMEVATSDLTDLRSNCVKIGATDDFESQYMAKFRQLAAPHGLFVEYPLDRAGRDIGLHLTQPAANAGAKIVTPALIWFQMKGLMPASMSAKQYAATDEISVVLETAHLRFWYMNLQATYLAVYIGSVDIFLAIDIKEWVRNNYGEEILTHENKTVTVKVNKRNIIDSQFFRIVLDKNLIPSLRESLKQENDKEIARFLRDSGLVKWLSLSKEAGTETRIVIISWLSKMRTEVYFENRKRDAAWERIRSHWQFSMGELADAFPFLTFRPKRAAELTEITELIEWGDDEYHEIKSTKITLEENDDDDLFDDEDFEGECLLSLGNDRYSYGEMAGGEYVHHEIHVNLNEIGLRWAATLKVLEEAEVIAVDMEPHWLSVAPWHARDI